MKGLESKGSQLTSDLKLTQVGAIEPSCNQPSGWEHAFPNSTNDQTFGWSYQVLMSIENATMVSYKDQTALMGH